MREVGVAEAFVHSYQARRINSLGRADIDQWRDILSL